jgi:hypothetical protein
MRLARLAAAGLAIGVIAGFAVALLRTRPSAAPSAHQETTAREYGDERRQPQGQRHDQVGSAGQPVVVDVDSSRRVTG